MQQRAWLIGLAGAAAVAWIQLDGVHAAARAWAVALLVVLPALLIVEGRRLREVDTLPRTQAYTSSMASLWLLALATLGIARLSGIGLADLGLTSLPPLRTVGLAALLTTAGVAILFLFRMLGMREAPILHQLLPHSQRDRILFVGVSLTAGICEEIIFRGFLIHVLDTVAPMSIALLLSSGAFGVAHAYQQPVGALRAALLGLVLAVPFVLHGSIVPAIIAHAAIDLLSGLWLARWLLR